MKQIITFIKSDFSFGGSERYAPNDPDISLKYLKVQIDNHRRLGLDDKDLIIGTNFDFSYNGIVAHTVELTTNRSAFMNKLPSYLSLIDKLKLNENLLLRDFDTWQLIPFDFPEEVKDIGLVRHSLPNRGKLQGGAVYVRPSGYDLLRQLSKEMTETKATKEESYMPVFFKRPENNSRLTVLDYSWNMFRQSNFKTKYLLSTLPLKLAHFHTDFSSTYNCFVLGQNAHNVKVVPEALKLIFDKHDLTVKVKR